MLTKKSKTKQGDRMKRHNCNEYVEYEDLATIPLPPARDRFVPMAHQDLYDRTVRNLSMLNYEPVKPQFLVDHTKQKFVATFGIKRNEYAHDSLPQDFANDDYQFEVGVINSNDGTMSAKIFTGTRVFVCANGQWSGEVQLSRKHTRNAADDINRALRDFVFDLEDTRRETFASFDQLKEYDFSSKSEVHDFVVESCNQKILPWQHAPKVLEHWNNPEHHEFKDRNGYCLFNAYTSHWRDTNQFSLSDKTRRLRTFIDDFKTPEYTGSDSGRHEEVRAIQVRTSDFAY